MTKPHRLDSQPRRWLSLTLLTLFILLIYSNAFQASWHLDDFPNITHNTRLHISEVSPQTLWQTLHAKPGAPGKLFRPLPNVSFAFNWYIGQHRPVGYHIVNVVLHIITAGLIYLFTLRLFQTSRLSAHPRKDVASVALLSALLWAIHPIQVQAVTYIVQRMAIMAAMFYMLSLYAYLRARQATFFRERLIGYTGCMIGYLAAIASKENAVVLPIAIALLEFGFLTDWEKPKEVKRLAIIAAGLTVAVGLLALLIIRFFIWGDVVSFFQTGYDKFAFSLWERLLTQPRVVLFYLSQLIYPVPHRFSIEHEVAVSTSLTDPLTTLPAILVIAGLIALGIMQLKHRPLIAVALLFFFINHTVESSVLPLDLIFEHRNYLPSMLFFIPVAWGIIQALRHYANHRRSIYWMGIGFVALVLFSTGMATYIRNAVWHSEKSLWMDALSKAPNFARPYHNIAWGYFEPRGRYDDALRYYHLALEKKDHFKHSKYLRYNNIAGIHARRGELAQAAYYYQQSIRDYPPYLKAHLRLANIRIQQEDFSDAEYWIDQVLAQVPDNFAACRLKGLVLIKEQRPREAIDYLRKSRRTHPEDRQTLLYIVQAYRLMENAQKADWYLKRAAAVYPHDPSVQLVLIETALIQNDLALSHQYADRLLRTLTMEEMETVLTGQSIARGSLVVDYERIIPFLVAHMQSSARTALTLSID
jgi:Tfp pilus assembly protein PilF